MSKAVVGMLGLASLGFALDPASLAPNRWHKAPLHWRLPASEPGGAFQARGWGSLQYNAVGKSLVFYEGFGPSSRGDYCIYGNALYEYSPASDTVALRSLGNWFCEVGHLPSPLAADNAVPTPMDRHTYSQFAYASSTHSLYLAHGASGSGNHPHDLWAYAFADAKWTRLGAAPGGTEGWECDCDGHLLHHPPTDELIYIRSRSEVHAYSLRTGTWRRMTIRGAASGVIGAKGAYDSKRDRFVFFGNVWTADDRGTADFLLFEPATGTWTAVPAAGTWPPARSYATMLYLPGPDLYLLQGGWRQGNTWVFDPAAETWSRPALADSVPGGGKSAYAAYDAGNGLVAAFEAGAMYLLRYLPAGTGIRRGRAAPRLRVVFARGLPAGLRYRADGRGWEAP